MNEELLARRFVSAVLFACLSSLAKAQVCAPEWSDRFGSLDISGSSVRASVVWDDDGPGPHAPALYVGGFFDTAGGVPVNGMAKWDGKTWSALGAGLLSNTGQTVWALAVFDDDGPGPHLPALYAAGDFFQAGAVSANWIAKWDGTTWTALGTGLAGGTNPYPAAHALAVFDEDGAGPNPPALFVGGDFATAGGVAAKLIARWNGATWSAVANGNAIGSSATVSALVVHDADGAGPGLPMLYAGGSFSSLGGGAGANISRWNGTTWAPVGTSNFNDVTSLASVDHDGAGANPPVLYAGGYFASPINNTLARFNGTSWSAVSGGADGFVWSMAAIDDDGAGPGGDALYIGGEFTHAGGVPANHVARFDGTTWSALGSGVSYAFPPVIVYTFAKFDDGGALPAPGILYVGGFFDTAGGAPAGRIARWDGSNWSSIHNGVDATIRALQVFDEDGAGPGRPALFAGGRFAQAGGIAANHIVRYDGSTWTTLGVGTSDEVDALCVFDDDDAGPNPPALFAGGAFTTAGGGAANGIAKWTGSSWVPLGNGIAGSVLALAVFDDDGAGPNPPALYAGGYFAQAGSTTVSNIARWDGTSWTALGAGVDGTVTGLAVFDPDGAGPMPATLVVGGWFTHAGGAPAVGVAQWNGVGWSTLGTGLGGTSPLAFVLGVFDPDGAGPLPNQLIIGGEFTSAGGHPAARIASWNGTTWSALSSGMNSDVTALLSFDPDGAGPMNPVLIAGGKFATAGSTPASDIATWDGTTWSALAGGLQYNLLYWSGVAALAIFDDDDGGPLQPAIYAGGDLELANGHISSLHIARWGAPLCGATSFCFGDGTGTICPCGNNSPIGANSGCLNSLGTGGNLATSGNASIGADTLALVGTAMPNSSALYFQGTAQQGGGVGSVFGDGLRCASGSIIRLGTKLNASGASQYPVAGDLSISVKGGAAAGNVRTYQCWYRNPAAFCTTSTFNLTNGVQVTWQI